MQKHNGGLGVMPEHPYDLTTELGVIGWIADNEPGGLDKLRDEVVNGYITGDACVTYVKHWLARHDQAALYKLQQRSTGAAETSAEAAKDAAESAKLAARWAIFSALIAAAALIVSAWPYLKDLARQH